MRLCRGHGESGRKGEAGWTRCAGVDVGKKDAKVCIRVQGRGSTRTRSRVTTWSSMMGDILRLRQELVAERVELVVLESTSDYWRPFF